MHEDTREVIEDIAAALVLAVLVALIGVFAT